MSSSPRKKPIKQRPGARRSQLPVGDESLASPRTTSPRSSPRHVIAPSDVKIPASPGRSDKVIVLDLDETLIHTDNRHSGPPDRRYVLYLQEAHMKGTMRPYVKEFLDFLRDTFARVIVWTAGTREYAEAVVDVLFESDKRPYLVLARENCRESLVPNGMVYTKPTTPLAHQHDIDPTLVLTIDDKPHTFSHNHRNGLLIPPYMGDENDTELVKVMNWMCSPDFQRADTITSVDKSKVF